MAHAPLSQLEDWHLAYPEQDIRGWKVVDAAGKTLGRVDELLVSTDTELVEVVRLDDGSRYTAADIEIGEGIVYVRGARPLTAESNEPVVKVYSDARIHRREETGGDAGLDIPDHGEYEDDFRSHYTTIYASTGEEYAGYEPAYHYGFVSSFDPSYQGKSWDEVEQRLRDDYERRHGRGTWVRHNAAVRHGWSLGADHGRT